MNMRLQCPGLLLVAVMAVGCGKRPAEDPPVIYVEDDDPEMKSAIDKAQKSLPDFIRALKAPKPSQSGFAIKTPLSEGKQREHIWLTPVTYDGKTFHGTLNNRPKKISGVKLGTQISIQPGQVSDWMYIEDKKLMGGYTIRLLYHRMPAKERQEFDRSVSFTID